ERAVPFLRGICSPCRPQTPAGWPGFWPARIATSSWSAGRPHRVLGLMPAAPIGLAAPPGKVPPRGRIQGTLSAGRPRTDRRDGPLRGDRAMATARLAAVLRHIGSLAADQKGSEQTDGALLRAFLDNNDQQAFEALVRRHGPMVLRVCRRTLGNAHDAEDAL